MTTSLTEVGLETVTLNLGFLSGLKVDLFTAAGKLVVLTGL